MSGGILAPADVGPNPFAEVRRPINVVGIFLRRRFKVAKRLSEIFLQQRLAARLNQAANLK
jgi:hypothetical protein